MTPSRRQFVASTLAGLPVLLHGSLLQGSENLGKQAQVATTDPVLGQIKEDLERILNELVANPRRADTARALESTLRFHAAWGASKGLDAVIKKELKRATAKKGRAAFVAEARRHGEIAAPDARRRLGRKRAATVAIVEDEFETALDRLLREGLTPTLLAAADSAKKLAEHLASQPDGAVVRVVRRDFYGICEEARRNARYMYYAATGVCALAVGFPALWPECYAAWLYWAFADEYAYSVCGTSEL